MSQLEDVDIVEAEVQQLLDEWTDSKSNLVQNNGYLPRQGVPGSSPRVSGHALEDNSDLPLLEPEGQFRQQAQYRHKCRNGND